jgi:hypothetical protein
LKSKDPEVQAFVEQYLKPYHQIPNLFEVVADLDGVDIRTTGEVNRDRKKLPPLKLPPCSLTFARDSTGQSHFEKILALPGFVATEGMSQAQLEQVIQNNKALQEHMKLFREQAMARASVLKKRWKRFNAIHLAMRIFTKVAHWRSKPYIGAVLDLMPRLIAVHKRALDQGKDLSLVPPGFARALEQSERNLQKALSQQGQAQFQLEPSWQ